MQLYSNIMYKLQKRTGTSFLKHIFEIWYGMRKCFKEPDSMSQYSPC